MPDQLKPHTLHLSDKVWTLLRCEASTTRRSVSATADLILGDALRPNSDDSPERSNHEIDNYDLNPAGTSLQGYVHTDYERLVQVFGQPNGKADEYKTQVEWWLAGPSGTVTIYDYKQGDCYHGKGNGIPARDVTEWHIGGRLVRDAKWVQHCVNIGHIIVR